MCFILREIRFGCGCSISNNNKPLALRATNCKHWNHGSLDRTCEPMLNGRTWEEWPSNSPRFPKLFCSAHKELKRQGKSMRELPPTVFPSLLACNESGVFENNKEYSQALRQMHHEMCMLEAQNALVSNKLSLEQKSLQLEVNCDCYGLDEGFVDEVVCSLHDQINAQMVQWRELCRQEP